MTAQIKAEQLENTEPSAKADDHQHEHPHSHDDKKDDKQDQQPETDGAKQSAPVDDPKSAFIDQDIKFISILEEILARQEENQQDSSYSQPIDQLINFTSVTTFIATEAASSAQLQTPDSPSLTLSSGTSFVEKLEGDNFSVTSVGSLNSSNIGSLINNDLPLKGNLEASPVFHSRDVDLSSNLTRSPSVEHLLRPPENNEAHTPTMPSGPTYPSVPDIVYNIKSGVYTDNDLVNLSNVESWLGRTTDVQVRINGTNWTDYANSAANLSNTYQGTQETVFWSVALLPQTGATLEDAAIQGTYQTQWTNIALDLVNNHAAGEPIYIKVGENFNLSGLPWSAAGKETAYIAAYQNFVDAFRSVSSDFVFEWTPYASNTGMNPALAYPGDNYVDIIGMSFHWDTVASGINSGASAWSYILSYNYGLQWLENFADAHGKQTAYSDWGMTSDRGTDFIESAAIWFAQHDVAYNIYNDSNSDFASQLSNGQYPHTEQVYQLIFGSDSMVVGSATAAETLQGDDHNNYLNGQNASGFGHDTLIGYGGDDVYTIHDGNFQHPYETIIERPNDGNDTILNLASNYTMPANVENIINIANLGISTQTVIGNDLDNIMRDGLLHYGSLQAGYVHRDTFNGKGGADTMYGGWGPDTFIFDDVNFSGIDTVKDFDNLDKLVFTDLLDTFDPIQDVITDFLNITQNGSNSVVSVDRDGAGTAYGWQTVVILENTTGLTDEAALQASGKIVI